MNFICCIVWFKVLARISSMAINKKPVRWRDGRSRGGRLHQQQTSAFRCSSPYKKSMKGIHIQLLNDVLLQKLSIF